MLQHNAHQMSKPLNAVATWAADDLPSIYPHTYAHFFRITFLRFSPQHLHFSLAILQQLRIKARLFSSHGYFI